MSDIFRFFWISWNSTSVSVGKSNIPGENVLMSSNELTIPINYVSASTAQQSDAYWRFHTGILEFRLLSGAYLA